ncbi:MAG: HAD family phosphatase [Solirubrobacterales bacterium]|nr:HAD family phosphatase [Solirubrobacterales bacterium]
MPVDAVIFDMDGVIVDSEALWDEAREDLVKETGGRWGTNSQEAMMGMASHEWSVYVRDELQVPMSAEDISREVVARLEALYRADLPLIEGSAEAVRAAAERWPVAIASSSNRELIDLIAELAGIADMLSTTVSSEEAGRGKPAPDVFLMAAEQLGVDPANCVVIEDSANGIRAGVAAGMKVIAAPNKDFPPSQDALDLATLVLDRVADITNQTIEHAGNS